MVKGKKLFTHIRLLAKQFWEKKEAQKKREQFSQVTSNLPYVIH